MNINDRFVPAAKVLIVLATVTLSLGILRSQVSARMKEDLPGGASIELNSLVSQEVAFSTATKPNPFNLDSLNTDHNTLNFVSSRAESRRSLCRWAWIRRQRWVLTISGCSGTAAFTRIRRLFSTKT